MRGTDDQGRDAGSKPAQGGLAGQDGVRAPSEPKLRLDAPTISLPKGGGAIKGIDETYTVNPASGTASIALPLPLTPARGGASPPVRLRLSPGRGALRCGTRHRGRRGRLVARPADDPPQHRQAAAALSRPGRLP